MENVRCGQEGPSAARPQITLVALVRFSFFGSTERSHSGLSAAMEKFSKGVNVECGVFKKRNHNVPIRNQFSNDARRTQLHSVTRS
jgi:hypothetical protein